ncbi:MAG TPA: hypothetical protein VJ774_04845 [Actinomycetota bacterium]|nr:hypothetical protein [Actinomycetota bacterium]
MESDPFTDDSTASPFASRLAGLGIGLLATAVLVMLPFLVPIAFYVVANVYAATKGTTFSSGSANEGVLLALLVLSVAIFPVVLSILVGLLGRALSPKHRR